MKILSYARMGAVIAAALAASATADAAVRYVKAGAIGGDGATWATAMGDLQDAIDASSPGDEVWVAAGIYKPTKLTNDRVANSRSFVIKDGVSLYGGFAGTETDKAQRAIKPTGKAWDMTNETILSGDDEVPDTWIREITPGTTYRYSWRLTGDNDSHIPGTQNNSTHVLMQLSTISNPTVIDGFTVTGGCANQHKTKASGGGIYAIGNVSVNACRIVENSAYFRNEAYDPIYALGGGIYLNGAGSASVTNCYFARNFTTSSYTVGMGGGLFAQNARVEGCVFEACVGEDGGGAMYQSGGSVKDCYMSDCYASSGGGLYTIGGSASDIEVTNCRGLNGGGISVFEGSTLTHAKVWNCYADVLEFGDDLGGSGGGIYIDGGSVLGCVVYNNTSFNGGGICVRSGKAVNCTVQNNSTRKNRTAVVNIDEWPESGMLATSVFNCLSAPNVEASNFKSPTNFNGWTDNALTQLQLKNADWSLAAGSEFIDAGDNASGIQESTDMAGNPRVMGDRIDVGAYEYVNEAAANASLTFEGGIDEVVIRFRTTDGVMKFEVGGDTFIPSNLQANADKAVAVPLNGNTTVKIIADGLSRLNIDAQGLTAISLNNVPGLTMLQLDNNKLTDLDVSGTPLLTGIYAAGNQIETIKGLAGCTALRVLNVHDNRLAGSLDLRSMPTMMQVEVYNNNLTQLLLPTHKYLMDVDCENNNLTAIDVAGRQSLRDLAISGNSISRIDVSGCPALENLYAGENKITEITGLADCAVLQTLNLSHNLLTDIDISVAPSITGLYLYNNSLTSLDVTANVNLSWVNINDNHIDAVDLSKLSNLRLFFANGNELSEIDFSNAPYCMQIQLADNNLSSIDLSKLASLYWLKVDGNKLQALDITANSYLSLLECGRNNISTLDLHNNATIRRVAAENNRLTALDVAANKDLCSLTIQGNDMQADAINSIIAQLPDVNGQEPVAGSEWITMLDISSMPGTPAANVDAARAKGWSVTAIGDGGITDLTPDSAEVVDVTYYTLSGICLGSETPSTGLYIVKMTLTDGRVINAKQFVK